MEEVEVPADLLARQLASVGVLPIGISGSWGGEFPYSPVIGEKVRLRLVSSSSRTAGGRCEETSKRIWLAGVT